MPEYERPEVVDLRADLARARGFLLEHENTESPGLTGDVEVPVYSRDGEITATRLIPEESRAPSENDLVGEEPAQSAAARERLLRELATSEAQLLCWLVSHPHVATEELLESYDHWDPVRAKFVAFIDAQEEWGRWLLEPSLADSASQSSTLLYKSLSRTGLERKHCCETIREGLVTWRASRDNGDTPHSVFDIAVEFWAHDAADIRRRLLEGNARLVARWAGRYRGRLSHDDSIRVGLIGFNRALDSFELDLGHQLSTYASYWIVQMITRASANHGSPVRVPVHLHERISTFVREFRRAWAPGLERREVFRDAARRVKSDDSACERLALFAEPTCPTTRTTAGYRRPIEEHLFDPGAAPARLLPERKTLDVVQQALLAAIAELLQRPAKTPLQEKKHQRNFVVVNRRLGIGFPKPHTLSTIGDDYDVTRERIRQVESIGLKYIRRYHSRDLADLLDTILGERFV